VKDEVYVPTMSITLNNMTDRMRTVCKNWSAFIAKYLARSRISSWCVQGKKWSTYWTFTGNKKKKLFESLFTMVWV